STHLLDIVLARLSGDKQNSQNVDGNTALHILTKFGKANTDIGLMVLESLLRCKCSATIVNKDNKKPIDYLKEGDKAYALLFNAESDGQSAINSAVGLTSFRVGCEQINRGVEGNTPIQAATLIVPEKEKMFLPKHQCTGENSSSNLEELNDNSRPADSKLNTKTVQKVVNTVGAKEKMRTNIKDRIRLLPESRHSVFNIEFRHSPQKGISDCSWDSGNVGKVSMAEVGENEFGSEAWAFQNELGSKPSAFNDELGSIGGARAVNKARKDELSGRSEIDLRKVLKEKPIAQGNVAMSTKESDQSIDTFGESADKDSFVEISSACTEVINKGDVLKRNIACDNIAIKPVDAVTEKEDHIFDKGKNGDFVDKSEETVFDNLEWEVECTAEVWKTLRDRHRIVHKIQLLASGDWQPNLCKKLRNVPVTLKLFEAKFSKARRIIWELAVAFSPRLNETAERQEEITQTAKAGRIYSEIIRVWDIVMDHDNIYRSVQRIKKSHQRGEDCLIQKNLRGMKSNTPTLSLGAEKRIPMLYAEKEVSEE
ncbi:TRNK1-like protein, partial [Mya arenaria]